MSLTYLKKKERILKVVLAGGIGNQFFMLFAALDIAARKNSQVMAYSPQTTKGFQIHGSTLESFEFKPNFKHLLAPFEAGFRIRVYSYLYRKLRILSIPIILVTRYYESPVLGYDNFTRLLKGKCTIKGYFQTYRHFENYVANNPSFSLELVKPSQSYHQLQAKLVSKSVTVIHVRLGDYFTHRHSIGVLSSEYFKEAISALSLSGTEVLVFSNDILEARGMLSGFLPVDTTWIGNDCLSAEESLMLMSRGDQFIISNSTFGYWGALLAKNPSRVIAPNKWFRGEKDPLDLLPPSWIKIKSDWQ